MWPEMRYKIWVIEKGHAGMGFGRISVSKT